MRGFTDTPSGRLLVGLLRAAPGLALGAGCVAMAIVIRRNGGGPMDWGGPAVFAILCGIGAVVTLLRAMLKRPKANGGGGADAPASAEPAFDPDAAIKRYMANRVASAPIGAVSEPAPRRPTFGKRRPEA